MNYIDDIMKRIILSLLGCFLFVPSYFVNGSTWEDTGYWGTHDRKPDEIFDPIKLKSFKEHFDSSIRYYISLYKKQGQRNKLCVIGYRWHDKDREPSIDIIWFNNKILTWPIFTKDSCYNEKTLIYSKPTIDLNDDVIPYREIKFEMTLWAKEGVEELINDCNKYGALIKIPPYVASNVLDEDLKDNQFREINYN